MSGKKQSDTHIETFCVAGVSGYDIGDLCEKLKEIGAVTRAAQQPGGRRVSVTFDLSNVPAASRTETLTTLMDKVQKAIANEAKAKDGIVVKQFSLAGVGINNRVATAGAVGLLPKVSKTVVEGDKLHVTFDLSAVVADRRAGSLELASESVQSTISNRSSSAKVHTRTGRGVGASGGSNI